MENNDLLHRWESNKHVPEIEKLENKMITDYLKPRISKVSWTFSSNLVFYLAALLACIILLSMNLYGYLTNPVMFGVQLGLLFLSVIFLVYGVFIFMKIREINNFSKNLRELLLTKIKFLKFHYEIWLIITAIVVWILSFALNTLVDNREGIYKIYRPGFFVMVSFGMLAFIYLVQKIAAGISLKNLRTFLTSLDEEDLSHTEIIEQRKKKTKWLLIAAFIILTILFCLGILKMLNIN